jgi:CRISPR-associated protein Csh1
MMGDYAQEKSNESLLAQLVENPDSNGKYKTVLVILFKEEAGEVVFDEVRVEEFSKQKLDKYAYKKGASRGGDLTPTSRITDLEKTFARIQKPLVKLCKKLKGETETEEVILAINNLFQDEGVNQRIYADLQTIEYDESAVLTIAFRDIENQLKYVGDFEEFTKSLMEKYEKKFYYKSSYLKAEKKSIGKDNICYICSQKAKETYGYVGTFAFYTLDKPGFASGGFNRGDAWKNYPVCSECAKTLDLGKKYLEQNLGARFCGVDYFIVPKTIFAGDGEDREEMFNILEHLESRRKMSLEEDNRNALTHAQKDIFGVMSDFDNYANFNLMFYDNPKGSNVFRILLYIEDVLPSYIKKIFDAKKEVEKGDVFNKLQGKEGVFDLSFKFNLISDFFPAVIKRGNKKYFSKNFFDITNSIFMEQKISYHLLINKFIAHLQEKFRNDESIWYDNLKALMILKFLKQLDLLNGCGEEKIRVSTTKNTYREQIELFLEEHSDILDSNVKRMVFLEGVLAQKLLNIQAKERDGSTPFRARLNGLKLNEKIVKRLYSEIINKLEEYDKNYYKQLEEMIADYILASNFTAISNNELSFYFVTGMNQANNFQFANKKKGDDK